MMTGNERWNYREIMPGKDDKEEVEREGEEIETESGKMKDTTWDEMCDERVGFTCFTKRCE